MPLAGSVRFNGMAMSSSCNNRWAKRPTYEASNTKPLGSSRVKEKSTTWEYGVFSLSFNPQVIANPPPARLVGGVTGKEPLGGGSTIGHGAVGQALVVAALTVGMVFNAE